MHRLTPPVRRWLYAIAAATLVYFTTTNAIDGQTADALAGIIYAALFGVALGNVPTKDADQ